MTLYIANTTKQNTIFCFRSPEINRPQMTHIPSGSQVALGVSWSAPQTDSVVEQLHRFGGRPVSDAKSRRLDHFQGLLYSTEKPVQTDVIEVAHDAVVDHQNRRAASEATKAAAAFDVSQRDKRTGKRKARITEVSVKQDIPQDTRPTGDEVLMSVSISPDGGTLSLPE